MPVDPNAGLGEEQLQPAYPVPVNTSVRTPVSPLHDLAASLSNFSGNIDGYLQQAQQKQNDLDVIRGETAATEANGTGYAELVRNGKLPTYNSDAFVQSYEQTQGSIIGKRLAANAVTAYQTWPLRNSQDPANMDQFVGDFIRKNLPADASPYVLKGALPYAEQTSQMLYTANAKDRSDTLYQNNIDAHVAASSMDIDNVQDIALANGTEPDYSTLWQHLMADRMNALSVGVRSDDYDKSMTAMIAEKALEHGDPGLLGMLKNNVPGQTYSYSSTGEGAKLVLDTTDTMTTRAMQMDRLKAQREAQQLKATQAQNNGFAIQTLAANPNAVFDPEFLKQAEAADPKFLINVKDWSATLAKPAPEDTNEILTLKEQLLNGAGVDAVKQALDDGVIHDPQTLSQLYGLANDVQSRDMQPVLNNQTVKDGLKYLTSSLTDDFAANPSDISPDAIQARSDFLQSMYSWKQANPQATYADIGTEAQKLIKEQQSGINANKYVRPDAITEDLAQQPAFTQGQPNTASGDREVAPPALTPDQEQVATTPKAPPPDAGNDPWRGKAAPTLDQLPQEQQDKINDRATALGVDPSVVLDQVWNANNGRLIKPQGSYVAPPLSDGTDGNDVSFLLQRLDPGHPESYITGLQPYFRDALAQLIASAPDDIKSGLGLESGARSNERQAQLWADALRKYGSVEEARRWVAPPGNSMHNRGLAADLSFNGVSLRSAPERVVQWVHENATKYGLWFPLANENWHVEPIGARKRTS